MPCPVFGRQSAAADTPFHLLAGAEAAAPQAADQAAPGEPETPADPAKPEAEAAKVSPCTLSCRARDLCELGSRIRMSLQPRSGVRNL